METGAPVFSLSTGDSEFELGTCVVGASCNVVGTLVEDAFEAVGRLVRGASTLVGRIVDDVSEGVGRIVEGVPRIVGRSVGSCCFSSVGRVVGATVDVGDG